jgi:hypothetical protein
MSWFLDVLDRLREANAAQVRLHERMALRRQPWLEEFLHWSFDGQEWRLHGHLLPPGDGRLQSVTSDGWCLGQESSGRALG